MRLIAAAATLCLSIVIASSASAGRGAITGFGLPVTCDLPPQPAATNDAWGVYHGGDAARSIQLRPLVCESVAQARRGIVTRDASGAVFALAHELAHSYGIENETGADCVGGSNVRWVARKLGVPPAARYGIWIQTAAAREESCAAWKQAGKPSGP
jgi:hypothetical protein